MQIVWNRNHHVDMMNVILYKCDILGSHREHADCSLCVTRNVKYKCTWCANTCTYSETCQHTAHTECPKPRIDMVSVYNTMITAAISTESYNITEHIYLFQIKPLSGPIEGGTLVTIEGSNLGLKERDVKGKIRIGDVPCELIKYQVSVKIQCLTGPSPTEMTAPIIVGNEAGFTESSVEFRYKVILLLHK